MNPIKRLKSWQNKKFLRALEDAEERLRARGDTIIGAVRAAITGLGFDPNHFDIEIQLPLYPSKGGTSEIKITMKNVQLKIVDVVEGESENA